MFNRNNIMSTLFLVLCFLIFSAENVYAYLDPGTGSILIQLLAAGVFGAVFGFKKFWSKMIHATKRIFKTNADKEQD